MKTRYRLFRRRGSVFYCFDKQTRLYTSLRTKDRKAAQQLVYAKNKAGAQPALCQQFGKVYLASNDPRTTPHLARRARRLDRHEVRPHARSLGAGRGGPSPGHSMAWT